tara:strand:- start:118 stop:273 length:156 start_codon:yes stop_codon:yes gene_type:complete
MRTPPKFIIFLYLLLGLILFDVLTPDRLTDTVKNYVIEVFTTETPTFKSPE